MQFINELNSVSVRLELKANGQTLSWGTGFFLARDGVRVLVSNKHVFSGRNTITGDLLSPTGAVPDEVVAYLHVNTREGATWYMQPCPLLQDGEALWVSPYDEPEVDIAFLGITIPDIGAAITPLGRNSVLTDIQEEAGMRIVILGFPDGMTRKTFFPIWKSGYVATEPVIDYDDQPMFLVDSLTSPGMSGSPVILASSGGHKKLDGELVLASAMTYKFLGIYSGRMVQGSSLGRVWKASAILDGLYRLDFQMGQ